MRVIVAWLMTRRWAEPAMATGVLAGLVYVGVYLYQNSYLPPPFFYEPSDTYADWFNTAFWARDPGTYDVWKTVYPPLSFVFIRLFGISSCYPDRRGYDFSAGLDARDCDWVGLGAIWLIFLLNLFLIWRTFRKRDQSTAIARTICLGLGLPMVDALERGNLVLVSLTALLLALGPILKSARLRWLAAGFAVNFKVYLIAAFVPLVVKRRWRWVEGVLVATVLVYLVSFVLLGRGTPIEIYSNIRDLAQLPSGQIMDQWYTTTYQPILSLISEGQFPLNLLIGSRYVDLAAQLLPLLQHLAQATILAALVATAFRPEVIPSYRVANLGILLALITSEPGGYTMMYFTLFTLFEPWYGLARKWAITACYLLAVPMDIILDKAFPMARDTYFGDQATFINYYVTAGPFLRPLVIITIAVALAMLTLRTVWLDLRQQGWADRWRYRNDAPLLPWIARPRAPATMK